MMIPGLVMILSSEHTMASLILNSKGGTVEIEAMILTR